MRRCLLPGIIPKLRASLDELSRHVQQELAANERVVMTPGFKGETVALREAASRYKKVFSDIVQPYIFGSLEAAVGNKHGAHRYHTVLFENLQEPLRVTDPVADDDFTSTKTQNEPADGGLSNETVADET